MTGIDGVASMASLMGATARLASFADTAMAETFWLMKERSRSTCFWAAAASPLTAPALNSPRHPSSCLARENPMFGEFQNDDQWLGTTATKTAEGLPFPVVAPFRAATMSNISLGRMGLSSQV